jgi:hypothetical protein
MESSSAVKSSITHTAVLWEVILDVRIMYAEAVQSHNSPVDHNAFGELLFIVSVSSGSIMIWEAEGLEFVT